MLRAGKAMSCCVGAAQINRPLHWFLQVDKMCKKPRDFFSSNQFFVDILS